MKKEPKAVYIIENGEYTELTYEEFRRREQICPLYADKLLPELQNQFLYHDFAILPPRRVIERERTP